MSVKETLLKIIHEVAEEGEKSLPADFDESTVLLESGLDSLDFAIIVARLDEQLGDDPFMAMSEPVYPRTFGDFSNIYQRHFAA